MRARRPPDVGDGYWYAVRGVTSAGGVSPPRIPGVAAFTCKGALINGVWYFAVRLPAPSSNVPTTSDVTVGRILRARGLQAKPTNRSNGR